MVTFRRKQVEFARTIHGAGTDLLNLISDILDLSKIESGTVSVQAEEVPSPSLLEMVAPAVPSRGREPAAQFRGARRPQLARSLVTDAKRLQQVLKNLLSNAFKFTEQGGVRAVGFAAPRRLERRSPGPQRSWPRSWPSRLPIPASASHSRSNASSSRPSSKQTRAPAVSMAAPVWLGHQPRTRQPPGRRDSTAQRAGKGARSRLPSADVRRPIGRGNAIAVEEKDSSSQSPLQSGQLRWSNVHRRRITDDRANLQPDDAVLLIVEDDPHYARVLCDLVARQGLQSPGRRCAAPTLWRWRTNIIPTAVSLDVFLPDMLGWTVLNHLKQDPATRHIPVQMLTLDEDRQHGLARGASRSSPNPPSTEGLEAAFDRIKDYARRAASAC